MEVYRHDGAKTGKTDIWRVDQLGEGTFTLVVSEFDPILS